MSGTFLFDVTKQKIKVHSPNWSQISDHLYRILISHQPDIDKVYLYAKDPYKTKYQLLIRKCKDEDLKCFNDSKAFIEYSNDMNDIYKNTEEYNPDKERKIGRKLNISSLYS